MCLALVLESFSSKTDYIFRTLLLSKPNKEEFKVDYTIYTGETESTLKAEEAAAAAAVEN